MSAWQCGRSRPKQATSKRPEFDGYGDDDYDNYDDNDDDDDEILTQNGSVVVLLVQKIWRTRREDGWAWPSMESWRKYLDLREQI
jgi:hypothetical protein